MLKKTITYKDFNDEEASEDFFFHLSKAELIELEMSHDEGLSEALKKIIDAKDSKSIIAEFKNIILTSYGKRSDDGKRFIKNEALRDEFQSTEAYSVLFMELVTDTNAAIEFINGIVPKDLAEEAARVAQATNANGTQEPAAEPENTTPITAVPELENKTEVRTVTKADMQQMSSGELAEISHLLATGEAKLVEDG